jgi:hypothetical protein
VRIPLYFLRQIGTSLGMARHSRSRTRGATPALDALTHAQVPAGFLGAWNRLVANWDVPALPHRRGRKPRVPLRDLLPALTYHVLSGAGSVRMSS